MAKGLGSGSASSKTQITLTIKDDITQKLERVRKKILQVNDAISRTKNSLNKLVQAFKGLNLSPLNKASSAAKNLSKNIQSANTRMKTFSTTAKSAATSVKKFTTDAASGMNKLDRQTRNTSNTMKALKGVLGGLSLYGAFNLGKNLSVAASDATESKNLYSVVFKDIEKQAIETGEVIRNKFMVSTADYYQEVGRLGSMFKALGADSHTALNKANDSFIMAMDIASAYNLKLDEAMTKIRAGLSGETEPLKVLGFDISVKGMEDYAEAQGLVWKNMTRQEQTMLRMQKIQDQMVKAGVSGDFMRTSNEFANSWKQAGQIIKDVKAEIGTGLKDSLIDISQLIKDNREQLLETGRVIGDIIGNIAKFLSQYAVEIMALAGMLVGGKIVLSITDEIRDIIKLTKDLKTMVQTAGGMSAILSGISVLAGLMAAGYVAGGINTHLNKTAKLEDDNNEKIKYLNEMISAIQSGKYYKNDNQFDMDKIISAVGSNSKLYEMINQYGGKMNWNAKYNKAESEALINEIKRVADMISATEEAIKQKQEDDRQKQLESLKPKVEIESYEDKANKVAQGIMADYSKSMHNAMQLARDLGKTEEDILKERISMTRKTIEKMSEAEGVRETSAYKHLVSIHNQAEAELELLKTKEKAEESAKKEAERLAKKAKEDALKLKILENEIAIYEQLGDMQKVYELQIKKLNGQIDEKIELASKDGKLTEKQIADIQELITLKGDYEDKLGSLKKELKATIDVIGELTTLLNAFADITGNSGIKSVSKWINSFKNIQDILNKENGFFSQFATNGKLDFGKMKGFDFSEMLNNEDMQKQFDALGAALATALAETIGDAFGLSNTKGGQIGGQIGAMAGMMIGGPIGAFIGQIGGSILGTALGGGGRNREANKKRQQENEQRMANNTDALNQLTDSIKSLTQQFSDSISQLSQNIAKVATISNIKGGLASLDRLQEIMQSDYDLGKLSISGEYKKKSFWKGTKRYYDTKEVTFEQIASGLGWDLQGKKITELSIDNLKKIADYLPTLTNSQLEQIWDAAGYDGKYNVNGSNMDAFVDNINEYIKLLEELEKQQAEFIQNTWLSSFSGISIQNVEQLTKEYEELFKSMGLNPDDYKGDIQEMVDANKVLITAMQDVRSSFISAFADGESSGKAFANALSGYFKSIRENIASVIYGTEFDALNEKLETIFKNISYDLAEGEIPDIAGKYGDDIANSIKEALEKTDSIMDYMGDLKDKLISSGIPNDIINALFPDQLVNDITSSLKSGIKEALKYNDISYATKSIGDAIRDHVTDALIDAFATAYITSGQFDKYLKDIDFSNMSLEEAFKAMQEALEELDKELNIAGIGNATTGSSNSSNDISSSVTSETAGATITNNYKQYIVRMEDSYVSVESLVQLADKLEQMGFERKDKDGI